MQLSDKKRLEIFSLYVIKIVSIPIQIKNRVSQNYFPVRRLIDARATLSD